MTGFGQFVCLVNIDPGPIQPVPWGRKKYPPSHGTKPLGLELELPTSPSATALPLSPLTRPLPSSVSPLPPSAQLRKPFSGSSDASSVPPPVAATATSRPAFFSLESFDPIIQTTTGRDLIQAMAI